MEEDILICKFLEWDTSFFGHRIGRANVHRLTEERLEQLKGLLHRSPRDFGKGTSVWTLALAAEVSFAEEITPRLMSDDSIRLALKRLKVSWKRAKHWITSPDPEYQRKKSLGIA